MVQSFGLPAPDIAAGAVQQAVASNGGLLQQIAMDATAPLAQTVTDNSAALGAVMAPVQQTLATTLSDNAPVLSGAQAQALAALNARTADATAQAGALPKVSPAPGTRAAVPPPSDAGQTLAFYTALISNEGGSCPAAVRDAIANQLPAIIAAETPDMAAQIPSQRAASWQSQTHLNTALCTGQPGVGVPDTSPVPQPILPIQPQPPVPPPPPAAPPPAAPPPEQPGQPAPPPEAPPPDQPGGAVGGAVPQPPVCGVQLPGGFQAAPPPGSDAWCQTADEIMVAVAGWGESVGQWLSQFADPNGIATIFADYKPQGSATNPLGYAMDGLVSALNALVQWAEPFLRALATSIQCAGQLYQAMAGQCNFSALLGLTYAKMIVKALTDIDVGLEIPVRLSVHLDPAGEQLLQVIDYLIQYACPVEAPTPEAGIEAWKRGLITDDRLACLFRLAGREPQSWAPMIAASSEVLSPREAIQWVRRNGGSQADELAALRSIGFTDPRIAARQQFVYDELPTIGDFLHFLTRNVFNADYVQQYGLLDGFDTRFWPAYGQALRAVGMSEDWAKQHYAAHWIQPAPTQMHEFVYRLRPGNDPNGVTFTLQDYKNLLAEQDVSPRAAEWFAATAYHVPAMGYIRDMYRQNVITDTQLVGYHQDLGYTEADSHNFLAVDKIAKARQRASQAHGWTPAEIAKGVVSGSMDSARGAALFDYQGYTKDEFQAAIDRAQLDLSYSAFTRARGRVLTQTASQVKSAVEAGVMSPADAQAALVGMGWPAGFAAGYVSAAQSAARVGVIKQAIGIVRRQYLEAYVDAAGAAQALQQLGVQPDSISTYVQLWTLQLTPGRRRRTASQVSADLANGEITTGEALSRLSILGYNDADSRLYLADASRKIAARGAKALAAQQKNDRAAAKAVQQQLKAAQAQSKQLLAALKRLSPPAKLQKWAKLGIIGHDLFNSRMLLYGFDQLDIDRWWTEACDAKNAACVETTAPGNGATPGGSGAGRPAGGAPPSP